MQSFHARDCLGRAAPRPLIGRLALPSLLLLALISAAAPAAGGSGPVAPFLGIEKVIRPEFLAPLLAGEERVGILVLMRGYREYVGKVRAEEPEGMRAIQAEIAARRRALLDDLAPAQVEPGFLYGNLLGFSATATLEGVAALAAHPEVETIEEDGRMEVQLAQGLPLINAIPIRTAYDGSGLAIGITDTGIDYSHPMLGGPGFPNGKVLGGYDFADNDADPADCRSHGTRVSGVAAGDLAAGPGSYIGGVAPGAKLYALKVTAGCTGGTNFSYVAAAWDWAVTHQYDDPDNPILVLNASLGSGVFFASARDGSCPSTSAAAANAVANGITVVAATGNSGMCDRFSHPACLADVIAVGAVHDAALGPATYCVDSRSCVSRAVGGCAATGGYGCEHFSTAADEVTCYSNSAGFMDLLAPANATHTTDLAGGYFARFSGTSCASPYAAGAAAVVQSARIARGLPLLTPAEVRDLLVSTGDPVSDDKNGIVKPRINLGRAVGEWGLCGDTIDNDGDTLADCDDPDCTQDLDGDGEAQAPCGSDCDDTNPAVHRVPGEVTGLVWTSRNLIEWDDLRPAAGQGSYYQVLRGRAEELPVGAGPSEVCARNGLTEARLNDPTSTSPGDLFFYLVRAVNSCVPDPHPYGADSLGRDRISAACP